MFKISTALANHIAVSGSLKDALDGFVIRAYSGPEPATADAAIAASPTNVLLCTLSVDDTGTGGTFDGTPTGGILSKNSTETWIGEIIANGTASFFRMVDPSDTGAESLLLNRLQGSVGLVNADFLVRDVVFVIGEEQRVDSCNIGIPMSVN